MSVPVYDQLRALILSEEIGPDTMLVETSLATRLGVSRTPIREALRRLEQDGLVERTSRGTRVVERSPEQILEIYELRILLEGQAARAAAERATSLDINRLRAIHEQMEAAGPDDDQHRVRLNRLFHEALWAASHNGTLVEVIDRLIAHLHPGPGAGELGPTDGWQAYMQWLAHGVRSLVVEHPKVFPLIATRHPAAPWLRPPLRSLEVVEEFLTTLMERGFSDERAVMAYRSFTSFLLGHLLLEASTLGARTAPAEEPLDEGDSDVPHADQAMELKDFPHLQRLEPMLSEDHARAEFERALEDLLDRIDRTITEE